MPMAALLILRLALGPPAAAGEVIPAPPLTFRLYSDFTCPFCYIAERSLVERLVAEFNVVLDWRGFELHPEIPPGGMSLADAFPDRDPVAAHARTQQFSRSRGVELPGLPTRLPNTRKALAVAAYAAREGKLEAFRRAAMNAYWTGHDDLEDEEVLRSAAWLAGLDQEEAVAAMTDSAYRRHIDAMSDEASRLGVTGIPAFVFPGLAPIVGCQSWAVIESAATAAGAVRRPSSAPVATPPAAASATPVTAPPSATPGSTPPSATPLQP